MNSDGLQVVALIVQSASVLVGIGASVVALRIAVGNRRSSLRQAHLMFELDAAVRLAQNHIHPGTSDQDTAATLERARMGAEASALAGALGPERIPEYWRHKFESEDELRKNLADPTTEEFWRWASESQLAVFAILREIAAEEARGHPRRRARQRR